MHLGNWLTQRSVLSKNHISIIDEDISFTYHTLNKRVNALSNELLRLEIKKGDRIAILSTNCHEFLELYFSSTKLGFILVPLNFNFQVKDLIKIANDTGWKVFFYSEEFQDLAKDIINKYAIDYCIPIRQTDSDGTTHFEKLVSDGSTGEPRIPWTVNPADKHMIMYTNGMTGPHKGAVYSYQTTIWHTMNMLERLPIYSGDKTIILAPLYHCSTINITALPTFFMGGTLIIQKVFEPAETLHLIEKYKITHTETIPSVLESLAGHQDFYEKGLSSLRFILVGGGICSRSLTEIYFNRGIDLYQGYGLTEAGPVLTVLTSNEMMKKYGSVGKPLLNCNVALINDNGERIDNNGIGEIVIQGPTVIKEYWNDPNLTKKTIRGGWLRTGDVARIDEENYMYILERKRDIFQCEGKTIYPIEVESVLSSHPKIVSAGLLGIPDKKGGSTGKVFIEIKPTERLTFEEIISFCQGKLESYKIPSDFQFVDALPKNALGRINKYRLRRENEF